MRPIVLMGHERPLTQVKYNREGDLLFSCSKGSTASVWYAQNGERLGTLEGHVGAIWSIDSDAETQYCVTGSADYSVRVWDISNGETVHVWQTPVPVKRVEWSPCGKYVMALWDNVMGRPGSLVLYHVERDEKTGRISSFDEEPVREIQTLEGFAAACVGGWTVTGEHIILGHKDGQVSKVRASDGALCGQLQLHKSHLTDLQFSLDKTCFITASRDTHSYLVDVDTLQVLKHYEANCPLNAACITPVKEFVIIGGGQDAKDVTTSAGDGSFEAKVYHKLFEDELGRVRDHFGPVNCIAVSPQGTSYTSGGEEGLVRLHHFEKSYFDFKYEVEKAAEAKETMQV